MRLQTWKEKKQFGRENKSVKIGVGEGSDDGNEKSLVSGEAAGMGKLSWGCNLPSVLGSSELGKC